MSRKILYLESVAGIAGDMFAASFVDAGLVRFEDLAAIPRNLGLDGVQVVRVDARKASMAATHLEVRWSGDAWKELFSPRQHAFVRAPKAHLPGDHWHARYREIDAFLENSSLQAAVKSLARKIFALIAQAEAHAHGSAVEEVAFHEIGAIDSIVDVVMAATCIAAVQPDQVFASPVKLGRGHVKIAHGTHAIPPPASAWLVEGMETAMAPAAIKRESVELSTPTGLAILRALGARFSEAWPSGKVLASGFGAGTMDLGDYPNVFRAVLLEAAGQAHARYETDEVVEICANIDDQSAEHTAWAAGQLLELGALDVWQTPVLGKKNRLSTLLSCLCQAELREKLCDWILVHTSSFGVRFRKWDRSKLVRRFEEREVDGRKVRIKIGSDLRGQVLKEKIEFEDWKKLRQTEF